MRLLALSLIAAALSVSPAHAGSRAASPEVEQAIKQTRIAAALAARERMDAAVIARDMAAIAAGLAPDAVLNGPNNRINNKAEIVADIAAGRVPHGSLERSIEFAAERGRDVIFMGEETTRPRGSDAGGSVHRRFTDVWTETSEGWALALRQATIYETRP